MIVAQAGDTKKNKKTKGSTGWSAQAALHRRTPRTAIPAVQCATVQCSPQLHDNRFLTFFYYFYLSEHNFSLYLLL